MYKNFGIAAAAIALAVGFTAQAELVYDTPASGTAAAEVKAKAEDRETSRSVIKSAEKAKASSDSTKAEAAAKNTTSIEIVEPAIVAPTAPISTPALAPAAAPVVSSDVGRASKADSTCSS